MGVQAKKKPVVFIIAGKARHGKNTVADLITEAYMEIGEKVCTMSFANTIKGYCKDYFGWDGSEETKPRTLLQEMGTDVIRKELNLPDFHVARVADDIEILKYYFNFFVIPDARFPNEAIYLRNGQFDVKVIHVLRTNFESPLTPKQQRHPSETALDDFDDYDYKIVASNMNELIDETLKMLGELK